MPRTFLIGDDGDLLIGEGEDLDFYAVLNLPKDATDEEITKAYRRRCLVFHPDRHVDEDDKKTAERVFVQIRRAHEVLNDPKKRAIFDALGVQGIDAQGWELVSRPSIPENMKKEYEFRQRLRENEIMLTRTHPSSSFMLKTSLVGLFVKNKEERYMPQFVGLALTQGVDCSLTGKDRVGLTGRVKTGNGRGDGSAALTWKRGVGQFNMENMISISGESIAAQCRLARSVFQRAAIIVQSSLQYMYLQGVCMPTLQLIDSMRLRLRWQGSIILALTPVQSAQITTTIVHTENKQPKAIANFTLASLNPNVRLVYTSPDASLDWFTEMTGTFSMFGLSPSIQMERRLSRYSRFGIGLSLTLPSCMLVAKFKMKSGHFLYDWHIVLCDDKDEVARSAPYGVVLPVMGFQAFKAIFRSHWAHLTSVFVDRTQEREVDMVKQQESQRASARMFFTKSVSGWLTARAQQYNREGGDNNDVDIIAGTPCLWARESATYPHAIHLKLSDPTADLAYLRDKKLIQLLHPCPCMPPDSTNPHGQQTVSESISVGAGSHAMQNLPCGIDYSVVPGFEPFDYRFGPRQAMNCEPFGGAEGRGEGAFGGYAVDDLAGGINYPRELDGNPSWNVGGGYEINEGNPQEPGPSKKPKN
ncbi:unnamed protein product, partial [Mesorhabditis spiculigera]